MPSSPPPGPTPDGFHCSPSMTGPDRGNPRLRSKSTILAAGVDHVGVIIRPGDREAYETVLAGVGGAVTLIEQNEPSGYGHAVLCGREFTQGASFLLQVSDHLYVSGAAESCTRQLLAVAEAETCAVSAVQSTPETQLRYYGTVAGTLLPGRRGVYQIDHVIEKPTPTLAEQTCVVPGLRSGHYLCFFGMHVLTSTVFNLLADEWAAGPGREAWLVAGALRAGGERDLRGDGIVGAEGGSRGTLCGAAAAGARARTGQRSRCLPS